jgi:hypothetical protein
VENNICRVDLEELLNYTPAIIVSGTIIRVPLTLLNMTGNHTQHKP